MTEEKRDTLLSVVIIGLNEAQRIGRCIDSVKTATADIRGTAIAYVDSRSTDESVSIALSKGVRVFQLGKTQSPSPAAGRFVGTLETSGKYILFVDGDTKITPGWIRPALELMEGDEQIAMINGNFQPENEPQTTTHYVNGIKTWCEIKCKKGDWISGLCCLYRREILLLVGNWNPFVKCQEEADLVTRIRYFVPKAKFIKSRQIFAVTPRYNYGSPKELVRRWKMGFTKGAGQILKTSLKQGYWKCCWPFARRIVYTLIFFLGLITAIFMGLKYLFIYLLVFLTLAFLRSLWMKNLMAFCSIAYTIFTGLIGFWEFLTVPPRTAEDFIKDYRQIS